MTDHRKAHHLTAITEEERNRVGFLRRLAEDNQFIDRAPWHVIPDIRRDVKPADYYLARTYRNLIQAILEPDPVLAFHAYTSACLHYGKIGEPIVLAESWGTAHRRIEKMLRRG